MAARWRAAGRAAADTRLAAQGLVDVDAEVKKLNKQLAGVESSLESLRKQMAIPDYENKVPEKIRSKNAEKVGASPFLPAHVRRGA